MRQYCSRLPTDIGVILIEASDDAILSVAFVDQKVEPQNAVTIQENDISRQGVQQLSEYFAGERTTFSLPLSPTGTAFQQRVWTQLCEVPYGETASYLDIAKALAKPTATRAVGAANGKNPIAIVIPCHRIIGANGKLTGYAGGLERKSYLLELESR